MKMSLSPEILNGLFAIGGAVIGALIAGIFAIRTTKMSKDRKELVISHSYVARPLIVHDEISKNIEVRVFGQIVDNILLSEIFLSNIGNTVIKDIDFPVECQDECLIVSVDVLDPETNAVRTGSNLSMNGQVNFSVSIDYINPNEEVVLRCMVSGDEPKWDVQIRQPGLLVVKRDRPVSVRSDVVAEALFEAISEIPILRTYFRIAVPSFKRYIEEKYSK